MARQSGLIKIKGTLDNVSFYKTKDGHLARMKTSVDGTRIANDPAFERTRENNAEFGESATAGKLLRDAVRPQALNASDGRVTARMTQVMSKIKNLDTTSDRGSRKVSIGLADPSAVALIKGFEFNKLAKLSSILYSTFAVDNATGVISFTNLNPIQDIVVPSGATHVTFSGGFAGMDFAIGDRELFKSNQENFAIDGTLQTFDLTPLGVPTMTNKIILLKMEFYQEINGTQYPLKNGAYNALQIVSFQ
jgi:hypothetical protein